MNQLLTSKEVMSWRASGWTLALSAFAVAVAVVLVSYWSTVQSLISIWSHDGTYQYAFLIFPLSLWTAVKLRAELLATSPKPSLGGLAVLAALVLVWCTGHILDINLVQHAALVGFFPALVLAFWGWRALKVLAFPLGYLVFAVPWGDALVGPLQDITAHFAVRALELTGTPVLLNGREIVTPTAVWMVADACSGVKFFMACIALGCLYAYLMYRRRWKRVLFVTLAAVVPVIANGFRVYFTVLIGDTWGLKYATGTDHLIFGWQFFGTVLVLLLLVGWLFRDQMPGPSQALPHSEAFPSARALLWLPALSLLVLGPALAAGWHGPQTPAVKLNAEAPTITGWFGPQRGSRDWHPEFTGADAQYQVAYTSNATHDTVDLFHAIYSGRPRLGHNLITYGNDVYDPLRTRILSHTSRYIELAGGQRITVGELRLSEIEGTRLVWYWYCIDQRCSSSPLMAKLLQAWELLRGRVPQSAVWALSTSVTSGELEQAKVRLRAFAHALRLVPLPAIPGGQESGAEGFHNAY